MTASDIEATAQAPVAPGKGIPAADESGPTIKKRFDAIGIESTARKSTRLNSSYTPLSRLSSPA